MKLTVKSIYHGFFGEMTVNVECDKELVKVLAQGCEYTSCHCEDTAGIVKAFIKAAKTKS